MSDAITVHIERLRFTRAHRVNARPRESLRPSAPTKPRPNSHSAAASSRMLRAAGLDGLRLLRSAADLDAVRLGLRLLVDAARRLPQRPASRAAQANHAHRTQRLPLLNLASTLLMSQLSGKRSERVCTLAVSESAQILACCSSKQHAPERAASAVPLDVIARVLIRHLVVGAARKGYVSSIPSRRCTAALTALLLTTLTQAENAPDAHDRAVDLQVDVLLLHAGDVPA